MHSCLFINVATNALLKIKNTDSSIMGIDLGNTNCFSTVYLNNKVEVVKNEKGKIETLH